MIKLTGKKSRKSRKKIEKLKLQFEYNGIEDPKFSLQLFNEAEKVNCKFKQKKKLWA